MSIDSGAPMFIDNIVHFSFEVNYQYLTKFSHLIFARSFSSSNSIPNNTVHTTYGYRPSPILNRSLEYESGWCDAVYLRVPGRLYAIDIAATIPLSFCYIVAIILIVYYRSLPPMSAKGPGPVTVTACIFIGLVVEFVVQQNNYEQQYYVNCFTSAFILYPVFEILFVVPMMHFIRYIVILNLNVQKQKFADGVHKNALMPFWMKSLTKLTDPRLIFFAAVLVYINICVVALIVYAIWGFKCGSTGVVVIRYVHYAFSLIYAAIAVLVQIFDFFSFCKNNFSTLRKCHMFVFFRNYFVTTDHFYFRLEFVFTFPAIAVTLVWLLMGSPAIIRIIFLEILYILLWLISGGLSLIITIFSTTTQKCKSKNGDSDVSVHKEIESAFANEELYQILLEFSKHEWSMENVYFKSYVLNYKRSRGDENRKVLALEMLHKFLQYDNSPFEINSSTDKIDACVVKIKNEEFDNELFKDLEGDVMRNLSDVYARFHISNEYYLYNQKMELLGVDFRKK